MKAKIIIFKERIYNVIIIGKKLKNSLIKNQENSREVQNNIQRIISRKIIIRLNPFVVVKVLNSWNLCYIRQKERKLQFCELKVKK